MRLLNHRPSRWRHGRHRDRAAVGLPVGYYFRVAALVFVFALAVVGFNLLMGSPARSAWDMPASSAIGAYAVAVGPTHLGMPSWLRCLAGAASSALVAFVVGRPILRLKGHYLAVATLGFGLLLAIVFTNEARLDRWSGRHVGAAAGALRLVLRGAEPGTG